jgi:phosphate transport system permease protein
MSGLFDPTSPLVSTGNLRRRAAVSRGLELGAGAAAVIAVGALALLVYGVASRGASSISFGFLTHDPPQYGGVGGGIASAIVGTSLIVGVGALIAVPIGVLCALYLTEFAAPNSRTGRILKLVLDLLQGVPTIVVGLFAYGLLVLPLHHDSGFAGAIALAVIMLPLIARSSQEVLLLVPGTLREAADALGVTRWRTVLTVILPAALGGIVTGSILAIARAAGETGPLLVVSGLFTPATTIDIFGHGVPNIPVMIFTLSEAADPAGFDRAWGAALVLLVMILGANIAARLLLARTRRRLGV